MGNLLLQIGAKLPLVNEFCREQLVAHAKEALRELFPGEAGDLIERLIEASKREVADDWRYTCTPYPGVPTMSKSTYQLIGDKGDATVTLIHGVDPQRRIVHRFEFSSRSTGTLKGGDAELLAAEVFGRVNGVCKNYGR